jgi:diaminohydroxyphosphoribosylaminopyrimidine deaminase / 5-amino-6-(5-phosphoribosylamino)uracil reductase
LLATAFQDCAVDRVKVFVAPKVFGGRDATTPVEGPGVPDVNRAVQFRALRSRALGEDVVIEGTAVYPEDTGPSASGQWLGFGTH